MRKKEENRGETGDLRSKSDDRSQKTGEMQEGGFRQLISLAEGVEHLSGWVMTTQSGRCENQSGWLETLFGSPAGLSGFKNNATGRVNMQLERQYFQLGRVTQLGNQNTLSGKGFNLLVFNYYLLFPENNEHRIRNNKSGIFCQFGWSDIFVARGESPGKQPTINHGKQFSAPALNDLALALGETGPAPSQRVGDETALKRQFISAPDEMSGQAQGNALRLRSTARTAQLFSMPLLATPMRLAGSIRLALKNGSKRPAAKGQQQNHKITVFYIPMSNSTSLFRLWERTRSSQGSGRIRACLLPFSFALTKNVLQIFFRHGFN